MKAKICCLCGKDFVGYGNNPSPLSSTGRCCDDCNRDKVIMERISFYQNVQPYGKTN